MASTHEFAAREAHGFNNKSSDLMLIAAVIDRDGESALAQELFRIARCCQSISERFRLIAEIADGIPAVRHKQRQTQTQSQGGARR